MADGVGSAPRYSFDPLEKRGAVLGLQHVQLITMAFGVVVALIFHASVPGVAGTVGSVVTMGGGVVTALWTREGQPLVTRASVAGIWLCRRPGRARLSDEPLARSGRCLPAMHAAWLRGISIREDPPPPGERPMGVVRDRRSGTCACVVEVEGRSFSLLDPEEQAERLESWRTVLAAVCRSGSPVARIQWVHRVGQGGLHPVAPSGDAPAGSGNETPRKAALHSYTELLDATSSGHRWHDTWVVLVVRSANRRGGAGPPGAASVSVLRREARLLQGQLRAAGFSAGAPLGLPELESLLASTSTGNRVTPGAGAALSPLATREEWAFLRADGACHATYWISEWPRVDVGPDFLSPLLLAPGSRSVAVVMAPVPADRALRQVRSARTADLADAELRGRAGFLGSARRDREAAGATRRETEIAEGHSDYRFSGYVTVSADDPDELVSACSQVEHAAQSSRLEIRRLFGRQAESFGWTLPIGRGLR